MKVFWWQTGLHVEPENSEEFEALRIVTRRLEIADLEQAVPGSPIADSGNQDSVGGVDKLL
jgi:hypothetical protein